MNGLLLCYGRWACENITVTAQDCPSLAKDFNITAAFNFRDLVHVFRSELCKPKYKDHIVFKGEEKRIDGARSVLTSHTTQLSTHDTLPLQSSTVT